MSKRIPLRKCMGCNEMMEKTSLLCVAKKKDGTVSLVSAMSHEGRGAYLCPKEACIAKAIKSKGLERSFHGRVPKEIYDILEEARKKYDI